MFHYFGFYFCSQCNNKFITNKSTTKCEECRINNRKESQLKYTNKPENKEKLYLSAITWASNNKDRVNQNARKWRANNPEKIKQRTASIISKITKNYVANLLNLKVSELTDDLYHQYKETIEFKRKVAKEHNISINKLK